MGLGQVAVPFTVDDISSCARCKHCPLSLGERKQREACLVWLFCGFCEGFVRMRAPCGPRRNISELVGKSQAMDIEEISEMSWSMSLVVH